MGYTHYWYRAKELDSKRFVQATEDIKKVADWLPIPLGNSDGQKEPIFREDGITLNGHVNSQSFSRDAGPIPWPADGAKGLGIIGEQTESGHWFAGMELSKRSVNEKGDGSYEPFIVTPVFDTEDYSLQDDKSRYFNSCKTAFRPYDLVVQCALVILNNYLGPDDFVVSSDGESHNWNEARDICQRLLGYGLLFEFSEEEE